MPDGSDCASGAARSASVSSGSPVRQEETAGCVASAS
jgi:hypothetical protein